MTSSGLKPREITRRHRDVETTMLLHLRLFVATASIRRQIFRTVKKLFHLHLHGFIHLDQRRPEALEDFAAEFLRRVNVEFASDERRPGRLKLSRDVSL